MTSGQCLGLGAFCIAWILKSKLKSKSRDAKLSELVIIFLVVADLVVSGLVVGTCAVVLGALLVRVCSTVGDVVLIGMVFMCFAVISVVVTAFIVKIVLPIVGFTDTILAVLADAAVPESKGQNRGILGQTFKERLRRYGHQ